MRHERIKVFEQPSRNQSVVLLPKPRALEDTLEAVASAYLGQVVYIGWPHLIKAKVDSVATMEKVVDQSGVRANDARRFEMDVKALEEQLSVAWHNGQ